MMSCAPPLPNLIPTPAGDIDWSLLMLLARTEAALNWPDLSLPEGLDLRHPGDQDWVSRVADLSE